MKTKHVTAVKPTQDFKALFGVGINVGPDAPVTLITPKKQEWFGDGRGEGGPTSNIPYCC